MDDTKPVTVASKASLVEEIMSLSAKRWLMFQGDSADLWCFDEPMPHSIGRVGKVEEVKKSCFDFEPTGN